LASPGVEHLIEHLIDHCITAMMCLWLVMVAVQPHYCAMATFYTVINATISCSTTAAVVQLGLAD